MANRSVSRSACTIGLDLGDEYSHFFILEDSDREGTRGRVPTTAEALEEFLRSTRSGTVAIEAGTHSPWVSRLITKVDHEVIVANPRQLKLIYRSKRKNDRRDPERLARLARFEPELLCPIRHRGEEAQKDLAVIRARDVLVRSRTQLINHVRGAVKSFGGRIPSGISAEAFAKKARLHVPAGLLPALGPLFPVLKHLTEEISRMDKEIRRMCREQYPETSLLLQVSGVGPITALTYVLTIEDPGRFRRSREVGPYLGLVPRQDASGRQNPELRITKAGDAHLRRLLVQCAQHILGRGRPDTDLRRWGLTLAERGGKKAKKRAVVAVARKLAVLLHCLWVKGEEYEPLRQARTVSGQLEPAA
jgi:transposase